MRVLGGVRRPVVFIGVVLIGVIVVIICSVFLVVRIRIVGGVFLVVRGQAGCR